MKLLIDQIKTKHAEWNRRQLTEADFYEFCEKFDILVIETPLKFGVKGMLWFVENQYVATINSKLTGFEKLLAMWHEAGHFAMHYPSKKIATYFWGEELRYGSGRREENEADAFALCAIIPKTWVESKTLRELIEDECLPEEQVLKRKQIYERYQL